MAFWESSLPLNDESVLPEFIKAQEEQDNHNPLLNVSPTSTIESGGEYGRTQNSKTAPSNGCTIREYEEQLHHLRNENLNLKLRIYMMEESLGEFHSKEGKENAAKANVDLRIQNEELKKELVEKKELLTQAYEALQLLEEQKFDGHKMSSELKLLHGAFESLETSPSLEINIRSLYARIVNIVEKIGIIKSDNIEQMFSELENYVVNKIVREESNDVRHMVSTIATNFDLPKEQESLESFTASLLSKRQEDLQMNESYKRLKLEEMSKLRSELMEKEEEIEKWEEKLKKSYEFVQGLTKALSEQKTLLEDSKRSSKDKDSMILRLTNEYNNLKAKVRSGDFSSQLLSEIDEMKAKEALLKAENERLKDSVDTDTSQRNSKALKYLKRGAELAIEKAHAVYQSEMKIVQKDVLRAVTLMRSRLEELLIFLQGLTEEERFNMSSRLSSDSVECFTRSLNESRYSTSLYNTTLNETVSSMILEDIIAATTRDIPIIELSFENSETEVEDENENWKEKYENLQRLYSACEKDKKALEKKTSKIPIKKTKEWDSPKETKGNSRNKDSSQDFSTLNTNYELTKEIASLTAATKLREEELLTLQRNYKTSVESLENSLKSKNDVVFLLTSEIEALTLSLEEKEISWNKRIKDLEKEFQGQIPSQNNEICCQNKSELEFEVERMKKELDEACDKLARYKNRRLGLNKELSKQLSKTKLVLKETQRYAILEDKEN